MSGFRIEGNTSGNVAEVDTNNNIKVVLPNAPAQMGSVRNFSENDAGNATGTPYLLSPETDEEFRLRTGADLIFDEEDFTYTAQNFTKHRMDATTFVPSWSAAGFNTNPTNVLTAAATTVLRTWKTVSLYGTETISLDMEAAVSYASGAAIPNNQTLEFGFGLMATTTPFDVFDGVYIRLNSTGAYGIIRNNSATDTAVSPAFNDWTGATWVPVNARRYQFIVYESTRAVKFWVADPVTEQLWLAASIDTPPGYGMPTASPALQVFARHNISGSTAVAAALIVSRYSVRRGGTNISTTLNVLAARAGDSILSPGTLTTSANQTITTGSITRPAAAAPSNTTALVTSLSGIVLETPTGAAGTDTILMAYQCPALPTTTGTSYAQNRRLRIDGVNIASAVQTALTGGPIAKHYYIAYGSTNVSLAGVATDTVTTKAARRVQLPIAQAYAATQGAGTLPSGDYSRAIVFQTPIFINPGEFVCLVCHNLIGTAVTAGTIQHAISFDYSWE